MSIEYQDSSISVRQKLSEFERQKVKSQTELQIRLKSYQWPKHFSIEKTASDIAELDNFIYLNPTALAATVYLKVNTASAPRKIKSKVSSQTSQASSSSAIISEEGETLSDDGLTDDIVEIISLSPDASTKNKKIRQTIIAEMRETSTGKRLELELEEEEEIGEEAELDKSEKVQKPKPKKRGRKRTKQPLKKKNIVYKNDTEYMTDILRYYIFLNKTLWK